MSTNVPYSDEPLGVIRIAHDFLPSPSELVYREKLVKITISVSRKSVDFFRAEAAKHHTPYQRMIRQLLDSYTDEHLEQRSANRELATTCSENPPVI